MSLAFSYDACRSLVEDFARVVPGLLARHPRTADLALELEKLNLCDAMTRRFGVAVVGQMRVGKSTLLNALIGRDLAPTGVNETTATVNWFRPDPHPGAPMSLAGIFRVHSRDGGEEDFPLERIDEWLGQGERALSARRIDFFADAPFLHRVDLIDTPGLRSVIDAHQETAVAFLEERLENESLEQTDRADAIIYAINPVARETDSDMLALFGEKTRLPGATVWNSLAVVQKWETLSGDDPIEEAEKKCVRQLRQLAGKVSAVIPTSGLLARLSEKLNEPDWESIARLAGASASTVDDLLLDAGSFLDDLPRLPISVENRITLKEHVPWPCLQMLIKSARSRGWRDAVAVRAGARSASGLDSLRDLLERRFFALSSLIKVSGAIHKASLPCIKAMLRLREQADDRRSTLVDGRRLIDRLADRVDDPDLLAACEYIRRSLSAVESDMELAKEIQIRIERAQRDAVASFAILEGDVANLEKLDTINPGVLPPDEARRLRALFGVNGPDPAQRLGMVASSTADMANFAENWLYECQKLSHSAHSALRDLYKTACDRLEQLTNHLGKTPVSS